MSMTERTLHDTIDEHADPYDYERDYLLEFEQHILHVAPEYCHACKQYTPHYEDVTPAGDIMGCEICGVETPIACSADIDKEE